MSEIIKSQTGSFCWVDLGTHDVKKALDFYKDMFGWKSMEAAPHDNWKYMVQMSEDVAIGAIYEMHQNMKEKQLPSFWMSYIDVDDVDQTLAKAVELGAVVIGPAENVENVGRMAVLQDTCGAVVALWHCFERGAGCNQNRPGTVCWNELGTHEPDKSIEFYSRLLGWKAQADDCPSGMPYTLFKFKDQVVAGLFTMPPEMKDIPAHWLVYFQVENCEEACRKALVLGGKLLLPTKDIPGMGSFAVIQDSQGAVFAVMQMI
ncbi:MAG: VOC family protein [Candidatus Delongbacteria bacterium]|nr:VOC family protein [Candidatus Delongbacteria bacterium]